MIFDSIENIGFYTGRFDIIRRAVKFVRAMNVSPADGSYEIDTESYAIVQSVKTTPARQKPFEAHKLWLDVHIVLAGCERLDVVPLDTADMKVSQPYDSRKDIMFFEEPPRFSTIIAGPGVFSVFGPNDAHRPCCSVDRPRDIRKVCIKIKTDAFGPACPAITDIGGDGLGIIQ